MSPLDRSARRAAIDRLLEELAEQRAELYRREAWGVRQAGLRDLETDQESTRRRLASLIGGAS